MSSIPMPLKAGGGDTVHHSPARPRVMMTWNGPLYDAKATKSVVVSSGAADVYRHRLHARPLVPSGQPAQCGEYHRGRDILSTNDEVVLPSSGPDVHGALGVDHA